MKPNLKTFAVGVIVFALSAVLGSKRNTSTMAANLGHLKQSVHHKVQPNFVCSYKVSD